MELASRVIKFYQEAWLKPYIDMNTELRKNAKKVFKFMNTADFGKNMENVRKRRDLKLVTKEGRRNYVVSESKYHTTKDFSFVIEMRST